MSLFDITMNSIDGKPVALNTLKGKPVLFVNVASQCGYTPQYAGLQRLYQKYKEKGLIVIGVPSNDFGSQEPGTNEEIKSFCSRNYSVTFPMMAKVKVRGAGKTPLYQFLTDPAKPKTAGEVQWNFEKFLTGKDGTVLQRFDSGVSPDSPELAAAIEAALR
ncbi:MAG: glutathione peroxidase [Acidobacteria bacterium]|nr:glutathione peroxidase [Acidobacteriota bacterium]